MFNMTIFYPRLISSLAMFGLKIIFDKRLLKKASEQVFDNRES